MLLVAAVDKRSMDAIEPAIRNLNHGRQPSNDGVTIRLAFPPLTEERRKDFAKLVRSKAEESRQSIRAARREARKDLESLEKDGEISTNDLHRAEAELDRLTKRFETEVDEALEVKTVELMEG